jgi:hypothetical protein
MLIINVRGNVAWRAVIRQKVRANTRDLSSQDYSALWLRAVISSCPRATPTFAYCGVLPVSCSCPLGLFGIWFARLSIDARASAQKTNQNCHASNLTCHRAESFHGMIVT